MKSVVSILLVATALGVEVEDNDSLLGSKIYDIRPTTEIQISDVKNLENHNVIDILQLPRILGHGGKVLVKAHRVAAFETRMKLAGIAIEVIFEDVKKAVENEREENELEKEKAYKNGKYISFTAYHRHDKINAYLDNLENDYPTVSVITQKTFEGRDHKAIVISSTGEMDSSKPVIIVEAGIHAREWIAPATALYIITKLVEDVTEEDLADKIDWVIVPVTNPDGYEFSHESYRMWRKTRAETSTPKCRGVDGNRNFDFEWMTVGSSNDPCADDYAGPEAFSEPETRFIRDLIEQYKGRSRAYLAVHSYGRYIMYPYGHDGSPTPDDAELNSIGRQMAAAIQQATAPGTPKYTVGISGDVMYEVGGSSCDYAYAVGGIRSSFTIELPGPGFDPPPSDIYPIVKETWQGVVALGRYVIKTSEVWKYFESSHKK